jgi:hypothetical protein
MCADMVNCQLFFMLTGKYPKENNYKFIGNRDNEKEMKSYMIGLALSQFLWSTHFEMYSFFKMHVRKFSKKIEKYLEIGPGHGLFFKAAIALVKKNRIYYC